MGMTGSIAEIGVDPAKLSDLRTLDERRFTAALILDYSVIALAFVVGHWTLSAPLWTWISWPVLWLVIANRQHALLVLMHDATHSLAYKNPWLNELVGEVLCGGPAFVSMTTYRHNHLAHHKWMNEAKDPDWARKLSDDEERRFWTFPVKDSSVGFWLRQWRCAIIYQFKFLKESGESKPDAPQKDRIAKRVGQIRLLSYVVLAVVLTVFGLWMDFLLFWLAPAIFLLTLFMRVRAIAEHFGLRHDGFFGEVRNVRFRNPLEAALLSPHNVGMHLDHHLFASVPFYHLPALHRLLLQQESYAAEAHINDGVIWGERSVWKDARENDPRRMLWGSNRVREAAE